VGHPPVAVPAGAGGVLRSRTPTFLGDESPRPIMSDQPPFDWVIDEAKTWPPRRRPHAPFGPGTIEVLRSCPLRGPLPRLGRL